MWLLTALPNSWGALSFCGAHPSQMVKYEDLRLWYCWGSVDPHPEVPEAVQEYS